MRAFSRSSNNTTGVLLLLFVAVKLFNSWLLDPSTALTLDMLDIAILVEKIRGLVVLCQRGECRP